MMWGFSLKNISRSLPRDPSAHMQPQNGKAGFKPCRNILPGGKHEFSGSGQGRLLADRHAGKSFWPEAGLSIAADDLEWQAGFLFAGLPANRNRFYGRNQRNRLTSRSKRQYRPQQAVFSCRLQFRRPEKHEKLPSSPKGFPQKLCASGSVHAMAEFKTPSNQRTR